MLRILTFCGKPAGFLGSSECYIVVTVPFERQMMQLWCLVVIWRPAFSWTLSVRPLASEDQIVRLKQQLKQQRHRLHELQLTFGGRFAGRDKHSEKPVAKNLWQVHALASEGRFSEAKAGDKRWRVSFYVFFGCKRTELDGLYFCWQDLSCNDLK